MCEPPCPHASLPPTPVSLIWRMQEQLKGRPLFPNQRPELRVVQLPKGPPLLYAAPGPNPENKNSAVMLLYQVSDRV